MALITCPECGKEISDKVKACPHCGYPIVSEEDQSPPNGSPQQVELVSVKVGSAKTKKIIIGGIVAVVIIAVIAIATIMAGQRKEAAARAEYIDNLVLARATMLIGAADSEGLCNLTKAVWRDTIYEEYHTDTAPYTQTGGKYNEDFNDSLAALFSDSDTRSTISDIKANQEEVAAIMRNLQNPPDDLSACFQTVESMYAVYFDFTNLAISPSGSLQTYSENFSTYDNDFMRYYDKLDTQIPEE